MKETNRCDEIVKLLFAARCSAKAIIDVTAVKLKFRFSAVKFVEILIFKFFKLLFDEAHKKVSGNSF